VKGNETHGAIPIAVSTENQTATSTDLQSEKFHSSLSDHTLNLIQALESSAV
jgi:hypothetical protein